MSYKQLVMAASAEFLLLASRSKLDFCFIKTLKISRCKIFNILVTGTSLNGAASQQRKNKGPGTIPKNIVNSHNPEISGLPFKILFFGKNYY